MKLNHIKAHIAAFLAILMGELFCIDDYLPPHTRGEWCCRNALTPISICVSLAY